MTEGPSWDRGNFVELTPDDVEPVDPQLAYWMRRSIEAEAEYGPIVMMPSVIKDHEVDQ